MLPIQQPWINLHQSTTHCPARCPFTLFWKEQNSRSCLFINPASSWNARVTSRDLCSVRLESQRGPIWIHGAYSQSPGSFSIQASEYPNPFHQLGELLEEYGTDQHIVVGDFNVHHPAWSGIRLPVAHAAAAALSQELLGIGCTVLTPPGLETYPTRTVTVPHCGFGLGLTLISRATRLLFFLSRPCSFPFLLNS